ncbi:MAG: substrate-binding domain-containing protein [Geminicoccaceae bacterium]
MVFTGCQRARHWDRQLAYDAATTILENSTWSGLYAINDGMALGVVEAVKAQGRQDKAVVFGTDGISTPMPRSAPAS